VTEQSVPKERMRRPEGLEAFRLIAEAPEIEPHVIDSLRSADEKLQLEPALSRIIGETDETPHGPTEIADLVTVHLSVAGQPRLSAVVIKGRAWKKVAARDVADQLIRAFQLPGVGLVVLAAVGDIQDDVKQRLAWLADAAGVDWMILDRGDLARLLVVYGQLCPNDGSWITGTNCACGYSNRAAPPLSGGADSFHVLSLSDNSFALAKRYSANILVAQGLTRQATEQLVVKAVAQIRASDYTRNELVERTHGKRLADVVWLFVYSDVTDQLMTNWIARALWVADSVKPEYRPSRIGEVSVFDPQLQIDWAQLHDWMVEYRSSHTATKGAYLRELDGYVKEAKSLVVDARQLIERGSLSSTDEAELARLGDEADRLAGPDQMLLPPYELADLDTAHGQVAASIGNLFLPFSPRGQETWPDQSRRLWLARQALDYFDRELSMLEFERQKVR
jgi:hypothetical protein